MNRPKVRDYAGTPLESPNLFAEMYLQCSASLTAFVISKVGLTLSPDLTQDTLVNAFVRRDKFRPQDEGEVTPKGFFNWLCGVACSTIADYFTREGRTIRASSYHAGERDPSYLGMSYPYDTSSTGEHPSEHYAAALALLTEAERAVFKPRIDYHDEYAAIARTLDISVKAVQSRLDSAKRRLHQAADNMLPPQQ